MQNSKDKSTEATNEKIDPLYVIFEQHLFNFQDSAMDRQAFILEVVKEYLGHLRRKKIAIPNILEEQIKKELCEQVNVMLVKKIYGSLTLDEYKKGVSKELRQQADGRYSRLRSS